jgi:hypothetical protein
MEKTLNQYDVADVIMIKRRLGKKSNTHWNVNIGIDLSKINICCVLAYGVVVVTLEIQKKINSVCSICKLIIFNSDEKKNR